MKVSTFAPEVFPGVNAALRNLADIVPNVTHSNSEIASDANFVILGGWVDQYQLVLKDLKAKGQKTAVWFMSSLGQSGFTPNLCEFAYLKTILRLLRENLLDYLIVGGRKIYYPIKHLQDRIILLPFPFNASKYRDIQQEHYPYQVIFFAPKHLYKNVPNQLIALALAQKLEPRLEVHINGLQGNEFEFIADLFQLKYEHHDWLPEEEYRDLLGTSAASMQVTYAEVCNYGAMEAMALGTPTLLSNVVDWLPHTALNRNLVVGRIDSPEHIAEKLLEIAKDPKQYSDHVRRMIRGVAEVNNQAAIMILKELAE